MAHEVPYPIYFYNTDRGFFHIWFLKVTKVTKGRLILSYLSMRVSITSLVIDRKECVNDDIIYVI